MSLEQKAKGYAILKHFQTNHKYGDYNYDHHLLMVWYYAKKYLHLVESEIQEEVLAAAWTHDLIEDCRVTYNDLKEQFGVVVAELTYALTNEKGRNRKARANFRYFMGIKETKGAVFLKLCDRLANVRFSVENKDPKVNMYRKENKDFESALYDPHYEEMFAELRELLNEK